jgi:Ricin-type beta-trefoil lectin domain/PAP2 superfamily
MRATSTGLIVCAVLSTAAPAQADVVTYWNDVVAQALTMAVPARPGPTGILDFAAVHVAMHDAIQAFQGRYEMYAGAIPGASGSPVAAAATAARDVLISRLPGSAADEFVEMKYQEFLAANGLSTADAGVGVGQQAASNLINARAMEGSHPVPAPMFFGGTDPGQWRPTLFSGTPPVAQPFVAVWAGFVLPYTLERSAQFRTAIPPPDLSSDAYAVAYEEVKALGGLANTARTTIIRTVEQTEIAYFFSDNAVLYWNRGLRALTDAHLGDIGDSGRMFALVNMAMADAFITAWNTKLFWNFWRPETAIQLGDDDGNPQTQGDPDWRPLIISPNYPDYTSGATSLSGAVTTMLANFFGTDEFSFSLTSTIAQAVNKTRTYERFSDAAVDVVNARIYEGIHYRFADVVARAQGTQVGNWAFARFLRPLNISPGLFQVVASHSQKCLDVPAWSPNDGIPLVQWACNGGDNQTWSLETASDGYSRLIARHSGKCLDVSGVSTDDRAEIIQWQCHGGQNQQWRVEAVVGGYQLVAHHSGKCLDVSGESTNDGGSIIQWSCHAGANQTWLLRPVTTTPAPAPPSPVESQR